MKKTVFLLVLALMIGSFGYSQILGGPTYQTEKPDRTRPNADVDLEHNINDVIILPKETAETVVMSTIEFTEIMIQGGQSGITIVQEKLPRYKCFIVPDSKPSPTGFSHQIKCVRVR